LFYALEQALLNILNKGVANYNIRLKNRANYLRMGMREMGLKFLIEEKDMCSVLTTVIVPSHIDVGVLRQKLRKKSIIIYEGKGRFKDKVFQVGNIGELSLKVMEFFLENLQDILQSYGNIEKKYFNPENADDLVDMGVKDDLKIDALSSVG